MTAQHIICLNTEAELLFSSKFSELELISAREIMKRERTGDSFF